MKYCPVCDERFDEEIIKFCTKDGTPLIEEAAPVFTALPSESFDDEESDFDQQTVIRRHPATAGTQSGQPERIVIPTSPAPEQQIRPRAAQAYYPPPTPPSTGKTIILTIVGTLVVLGFGAGLFWFLQKEPPTSANFTVNTFPPNLNTNLNTNLGFNSEFNFNTNANFNTNYNLGTNLNANLKTPTPTQTPKPSPSPSISPSPTPAVGPSPGNSARTNANARPSPSPTPRTGPRPTLTTSNRPPGNDQ